MGQQLGECLAERLRRHYGALPPEPAAGSAKLPTLRIGKVVGCTVPGGNHFLFAGCPRCGAAVFAVCVVVMAGWQAVARSRLTGVSIDGWCVIVCLSRVCLLPVPHDRLTAREPIAAGFRLTLSDLSRCEGVGL